MGSPIIYRTGLKIEGVKCQKCMRKRDGIVVQNRARWVIYLRCGHLAMRGAVLPPEVLENMKLINQKQSEDPRKKELEKHLSDEKRKQDIEKIQRQMYEMNRRK